MQKKQNNARRVTNAFTEQKDAVMIDSDAAVFTLGSAPAQQLLGMWMTPNGQQTDRFGVPYGNVDFTRFDIEIPEGKSFGTSEEFRVWNQLEFLKNHPEVQFVDNVTDPVPNNKIRFRVYDMNHILQNKEKQHMLTLLACNTLASVRTRKDAWPCLLQIAFSMGVPMPHELTETILYHTLLNKITANLEDAKTFNSMWAENSVPERDDIVLVAQAIACGVLRFDGTTYLIGNKAISSSKEALIGRLNDDRELRTLVTEETRKRILQNPSFSYDIKFYTSDNFWEVPFGETVNADDTTETEDDTTETEESTRKTRGRKPKETVDANLDALQL